MTITLGSLTTGSALHGTFKPTPWSFARTNQTFFGLDGAYILTGGRHTRELTTWVLPYGYSSHANLQAAIASVNESINTYGTMTWIVGADSGSYTNCIFNGLELDENPWYDAAGINGYQALCTIKFTQVKT